MLGVCAAAEKAKRKVMTIRIPGRTPHCRSTSYRFIGTSLHEGGEVAGCVPYTAGTAAALWNQTLTPVVNHAQPPPLPPEQPEALLRLHRSALTSDRGSHSPIPL